MEKIQLLYVENVITRKKRLVQQELSFFISVENLSYDKNIDIVWAGEDGEWRTLSAHFHSRLDGTTEYWQAQTRVNLSAKHSLPGNIQFALCYRAIGEEYWDNNHGLNYSSQADSGIQLGSGIRVLHLPSPDKLADGQRSIPITIAVDKSFNAGNVVIHWTTDNWQTTRLTRCYLTRRYWDKALLSNARNPNQYGIQVWKGWLKIGRHFRVQYCIACESPEGIVWDNNNGNNYSLSREQLKIMILNLHCYQEDNQDYKLSQIAKAINELDADVVCFQEVAENWNNGAGDWASNSARIINERLNAPYHIYTDWSHLGFDRYREGVAILSKYPFLQQEAQYLSDDQDPYSIHARKAVMAQIRIPGIGPVNVFSAHLSWWEDGFQEQFNRLHQWANAKHSAIVDSTLLCGDFNVAAGSTGYHLVIDNHAYGDQYLLAEQSSGASNPYRLQEDYRIDYIFMNKASDIRVTSARVLFTEQDYGRVSDHCGYFMTFAPKSSG